jgi:dephospho-CoA kinase
MRNNPLKVGVTGGIGAGKSLVCEFFRILAMPVYPADERAKSLLQSVAVASKIKEVFGTEVFDAAGDIDRKLLAKRVFNNEALLQQLNQIVHPEVDKDFNAWLSDKKTTYVLKEAALLVESGSYKKLDFLIAVSAPESLRIRRVLLRDPYRTEKDIKAIVDRQLAEEKKLEAADFVIINNDAQLLIPQILAIHDFLVNKASRK